MLTPQDHIYIRFTERQVEVITEVGRERQAVKTRKGVPEGKAADRDGADLHVMGFAAEAALAVLLGTKPNRHISVRGSKGVSLRAHGRSFNTKWVRTDWYDLRFFPGKVPRVYGFVLCDGALPTLRLVGWVPRRIIMQGYVKKELPGQGLRWIYPRDALWSMQRLLDELDLEMPEKVRAMQKTVREEIQREKAAEKHADPPEPPSLFDQD